MNQQNILIGKKIKYYARKDEDAFFEWLKKIECIEEISAAGDELYLHIASIELHDNDLRDLIALFYRYKIDMKQLAQFLTPDNRKWFYENKQAYWHSNVFNNQNSSLS